MVKKRAATAEKKPEADREVEENESNSSKKAKTEVETNTQKEENTQKQVGDLVPTVGLYENSRKKVNLAEASSKKKIIVFAVPGAFTPGCSQTHLPGYIEKSEAFKEKGIDEIYCISVNDSYVMSAWGKEHGAQGKVKMLADPNAEFTSAMGLTIHKPTLGTRSKRYSMVVKDGKIVQLNVEKDGTGMSCSLANKLKI